MACCVPKGNCLSILSSEGASPYPDEIIMASIDNMLYKAGFTRILRALGEGARLIQSTACISVVKCPAGKPPVPKASNCSLRSLFTPNSRPCLTASNPKNIICPNKANACGSLTTKISSSKQLPCRKRQKQCSTIRQRTPRVDFANPVDICPNLKGPNGGGPTLRERMKYSFTLCSLACRRLRQKLKCCCVKPCDNTKWLWTRLVNQENGCKMYEVYKDSTANDSPCDISKGPVIIFIVMPNGYIMPFESYKEC